GGDFDITKSVTINGAGSATTIVQAAAAPGVATERVFHVILPTGATVVFNDITIQNGVQTIASGLGGAGIRIQGAAAGAVINTTFNRCVITNNQQSPLGGGIGVSTNVTAATLTINDSTISNNTSGSIILTGVQWVGCGIAFNVGAATATLAISITTISAHT